MMGVMRIGTKTLVFGGHQVLLHPLFVVMAWRRLYHCLPSWREMVCIAIHDWGYWGKPDIDGEQGEQHPMWAAKKVGRWWGARYYNLVAYHSRFLARKDDKPLSRLCLPDKYGVALMPTWLWALLVWLSAEHEEYRHNEKYILWLKPGDSLRAWFRSYKQLCQLWIDTGDPWRTPDRDGS